MDTRRGGFKQSKKPIRKMGSYVPTGGLGVNQILNADFAAGGANWSLGTGWTTGSFSASHAPGSAGNLTSLSTGAEVGVTFTIFYHLAITAGTFLLTFGGVSDTARTATGDYSVTGTAITNGPLIINADATGNGSISEIRVQRVFF